MTATRLEIRGLGKSFASSVLRDIDLQLGSGEIHGLVGENGAGKSTLINILSGLLPRDCGELYVDGKLYSPSNMQNAMQSGFSLAAQELSLIENLSIAENILIRALPKRTLLLDYPEIYRRSKELQALVGLDQLEPNTPLSELSLAQKQLVELAKALALPSRILILDEPTAALSNHQVGQVHALIRERALTGCLVLYVSHRLDDVLNLCDRVSILRDGVIVSTSESSALTTDTLISGMSGKALQSNGLTDKSETCSHERREFVERKPRLKVKNLTTADLPHPISFTCFEGEVLGIAGLAGAGRSELLAAVYGLSAKSSGGVTLIDGEEEIAINAPHQAVKHGIGFVAEDRKTQGIFTQQSLAMNGTITGLQKISNAWGWLLSDRERECTQSLIDRLLVKCDDVKQTIDRLSGGNQQKLLIGRWIHSEASVILLDEPTRGVDVGAKQNIYDQLLNLRDMGTSMMVVSSELDELMTLCDRILVLSDRKLVGVFDRDEWSQEALLAAAFSAHTSLS
ncbi:MAG: sugar ABC transporter ATP-binding protein [Alteromonadaceae bacterium]|nr:MAG: sugar ABC transporter ATP-binding protein [Alteromonadaceae bacterium]